MKREVLFNPQHICDIITNGQNLAVKYTDDLISGFDTDMSMTYHDMNKDTSCCFGSDAPEELSGLRVISRQAAETALKGKKIIGKRSDIAGKKIYTMLEKAAWKMTKEEYKKEREIFLEENPYTVQSAAVPVIMQGKKGEDTLVLDTEQCITLEKKMKEAYGWDFYIQGKFVPLIKYIKNLRSLEKSARIYFSHAQRTLCHYFDSTSDGEPDIYVLPVCMRIRTEDILSGTVKNGYNSEYMAWEMEVFAEKILMDHIGQEMKEFSRQTGRVSQYVIFPALMQPQFKFASISVSNNIMRLADCYAGFLKENSGEDRDVLLKFSKRMSEKLNEYGGPFGIRFESV